MSSGVFITEKKNGAPSFRASMTVNGKHISLGSYDMEEEAVRAFQTAELVLRKAEGRVFSVSDYKKSGRFLPFDKWVILLNLRDNGIYIKTPIYLFQRYFIYYYDEETQLKFDVDDLFYYSNHKIMKRGGHLFVSDFGMQVSLVSRYGIHPFSVIGRDYRFVNEDPTDFRYGNIELINRYFGVFREIYHGSTVFVTKLHIRGDYIIGRYSNETEAAIAYNKAADLLVAKGFQKEFQRNYVDGISEAERNEIYEKVKLSAAFRKLLEKLSP